MQQINTERVGKVIDWELCKKLKFNHTNKWYMSNSELILCDWDTNGSPNNNNNKQILEVPVV